MKSVITEADARRIRDAICDSVRRFAANGHENWVLFSGGIDSACVLYALMDIGAPYKVVNFKFPDRDSIDTASVKRLQQKVGFDALYVTLEPDNMQDIRDAVKQCAALFGRIRKVKVETIYAMLQLRKTIPAGVNILTGFGGDGVCAYHKNDAMRIAREGETSENVLRIRRGEGRPDELRHVFANWSYCDPFRDAAVCDVLCDYTSRALNAKFPKSGLVRAFADYFGTYRNARKPLGFHKASCEAQLFEDAAAQNGFASALAWFNSIAKEVCSA